MAAATVSIATVLHCLGVKRLSPFVGNAARLVEGMSTAASTAPPPILFIAPSYARNANSRVIDILHTANGDRPPQYTNPELLAKYFAGNGYVDYSKIPEPDKTQILAMLRTRQSSLKETLNALKQTSAISLKNASYGNKIQHMQDLIEELETGRSIVPLAAATPAAAAAAAAATAPVIAPAPAPDISEAIDLIETVFAATYVLLNRNDPSGIDDPSGENDRRIIDDWNTMKNDYSTITLRQIIEQMETPIGDTRDTLEEQETYLKHGYLILVIQKLLGTLPNKTSIDTYKKRFVPLFEDLKTDIGKSAKNKDLRAAIENDTARMELLNKKDNSILDTKNYIKKMLSIADLSIEEQVAQMQTYKPPTALTATLSTLLPTDLMNNYQTYLYNTFYIILLQYIARYK
jgi:hypothetical protein